LLAISLNNRKKKKLKVGERGHRNRAGTGAQIERITNNSLFSGRVKTPLGTMRLPVFVCVVTVLLAPA